MTLNFEKGRHGPKPVTGRFDTREQLVIAVGELLESGISQNKIAETCEVACATINNIVKKIRGKEIARLADLKSVVLRGKWTEIPEIEDDSDIDYSTGGGADDVSSGMCGCAYDHPDGGRCDEHSDGLGRARARREPWDIEIPAP